MREILLEMYREAMGLYRQRQELRLECDFKGDT